MSGRPTSLRLVLGLLWAVAAAGCSDRPLHGAGKPPTCGSGPACGPTADQLFDRRKLAELRLTFSETELAAEVAALRTNGHGEPLETWLDVLWARWRHCAPYENLVPVTMEYRSPDGVGDVVLEHVGIRLRGSKTRGTNLVEGFKLYFELLNPTGTRKFGGSSRLNALTVLEDASLITECAAYDLMRDFDVPSPRCNHLKVYVNGTYYGLVQNAEEVDARPFLAATFDGDDGGTLYRCSSMCGYDRFGADLEYHGDTFTEARASAGGGQSGAYPRAYEQVRGAPGAHERDLIPMLKCGDSDVTSDEEFRACIEEWLDVDEWLRLIAAESLTPSLESFLARSNFFLYFRPDPGAPHGGRFSVYSWDHDGALTMSSCSPSYCDPFTSVPAWFTQGRVALVTRLLRVFKDRTCAAMNAFLRDVYRPELIDELSSPLVPAMQEQPMPTGEHRLSNGTLEPGTPLRFSDWKDQVQGVRAFMEQHRTTAQAQVDAACGAAPPP